MNKFNVFVITLIIVLNLSVISSLEFDNKMTYQKSDKLIEIKNSFGLGSTVGKFEITSHGDLSKPLQVIPGRDRIVMTYDFYEFNSEYKNGIGNIEFINMNTNSKIPKLYRIKEIVYDYYQVPITITQCVDQKKEETCDSTITGYETQKRIKKMIPYNSKTIPNRNITLALITDVAPEDYIDGIWTIAGSKITKHATWNASFDTDLLAVYDFNQVSGNTTELYRGIYNLSREGSGNELYNTVTSVLPNGVQVRTSPAKLLFTGSNNVLSSRNGTVIMWLQPGVSQSSSTTFWSSNGGNFRLGSVGGFIQGTVGGTNVILDNSQTFYQVGEMVMITFTWDIDASIHKMYFNDTLRISSTTGTGYLTENDICIFNGCSFDRQFYGNITDMKVYNRSLNLQEITLHYNLGAGLAYPTSSSSLSLSVQLDSPSDDYQDIPSVITFNSSAVLTGSGNLTNATIYVWSQNGSVYLTNSTNLTGVVNSSSFILNISNAGTFNWNVLYTFDNGTGNLSAFATSNYTFTLVPFNVNNLTYENNVYETSSQRFVLNISSLTSILSSNGFLNYDGTLYLANTSIVDGNIIYSRDIDIPLISNGTGSQNKSFNWEVTIYDGTNSVSVNTSSLQQNVSEIYLQGCGGTVTTPALNFTAYQEENLTRINPYTFRGTFQIYLGNGTVVKNQSFDSTSINEKLLCISPDTRNFRTNAEISYNSDGLNFSLTSRQYYFQQALINSTLQHIPLYLLNSASSTTFILKVQDNTIQPVANALIYIQRYYPGDGIYRTVQIAKTDSNGRSVGFYETETVTYKHLITKDGSLLLNTDPGIIVGETVPYTLTFNVGDPNVFPVDYLTNNNSIITVLSYNNTNRIVTYSYIDPTGTNNYGRLLVYKISMTNQTQETICDSTSPGSSATITCNMSGLFGTFIAEGYVIDSSTLQDYISFIVTSARDIMGRNGAFLGWIIILTAAMAFVWNPTVGIIVINATIIFVGLTGLLIFSPVAYFAIMGVSIILIWLLKT